MNTTCPNCGCEHADHEVWHGGTPERPLSIRIEKEERTKMNELPEDKNLRPWKLKEVPLEAKVVYQNKVWDIKGCADVPVDGLIVFLEHLTDISTKCATVGIGALDKCTYSSDGGRSWHPVGVAIQ